MRGSGTVEDDRLAGGGERSIIKSNKYTLMTLLLPTKEPPQKSCFLGRLFGVVLVALLGFTPAEGIIGQGLKIERGRFKSNGGKSHYHHPG